MKTYKFASLCAALMIAHAAADERVTLEDGRQIILKDNFTWEYLAAPKPMTEAAAEAEAEVTDPVMANTAPAVAVTAPIVAVTKAPMAATPQAIVATSVVATNKGTPFTVGQASNIVQTEQSGFTVVFGHPEWDGDELIIPTQIHNNGLQPLIEVDVNVEIYDSSGQQLLRDEFPVWRSIKRMANTYLRPGQSESGTAIKVELPKRDGYQFKANISDVSTRG